jgi:hypothetical protein
VSSADAIAEEAISIQPIATAQFNTLIRYLL